MSIYNTVTIQNKPISNKRGISSSSVISCKAIAFTSAFSWVEMVDSGAQLEQGEEGAEGEVTVRSI